MIQHPVVKLAYSRNEIICGDDGCYMFWPSENNGAYSEDDLLAIYRELSRLNESWNNEINDYYERLNEKHSTN